MLLGEATHGTQEFYDEQTYGRATASGQKEPCEDEVIAQLRQLRDRAAELAGGDGTPARDAQFFAEQNAQLAADAERYYRAMFRARADKWNLRDTHMADARDRLDAHVEGSGIVVWAHNSHQRHRTRFPRPARPPASRRGAVAADDRVIYRPESERVSHYLRAHAARQFDLLLHVDTTSALRPLERWSAVEEPAEGVRFGR